MPRPGELDVGLRDVTRTEILAAVAEYDELGQDGFLRKHGFDRARSYLLIHDGKAYDSKAIVGVAQPEDRIINS
jgi:5-methylcytosine-specific restriction enzyme A